MLLINGVTMPRCRRGTTNAAITSSTASATAMVSRRPVFTTATLWGSSRPVLSSTLLAHAGTLDPAEHSNREVLRLAAPIGLAFIPLGMALGLLIVHAGLAWWWAPVFAAVIYAGSLEFLMVGLAATAAPVAAVALTTFIVNSRHVFYALSFPLDRVRGVGAKLYSTYVLSDEAYAVAVSAEARSWRRDRFS